MTNGKDEKPESTTFKLIEKAVVPLFLAGIAYLQWQGTTQQEEHFNSLRADTEQLTAKTQASATKTKMVQDHLSMIKDYISHSTLSEQHKSHVIATVMKVSSEINLAGDGSIDEQTKRIAKNLPLNFALVSENAAVLADIGASPDDIEVWTRHANLSGSQSIRRTAVEALGHIVRSHGQIDVKKFASSKLVEFSKEPNEVDYLEVASASLNRALSSFSVDTVTGKGDLVATVSDLQAAEKDVCVRLNAFREIARQKSCRGGVAMSSELANQAITRDQATRNDLHVALAQDEKSASVADIEDRITKLRSNNETERAEARSSLGRIGQRVVPRLMQELKTFGATEYRVRLGVVVSILLMDAKVNISKEHLAQLTALLGDPDTTIRKTTALVLIELENPETLSAARKLLVDQIRAKTNENSVYNAVVVLGEWLDRKALDTAFKNDVRADLKAALEELPQAQWANTVKLIDSYRRQ